ncbi:MAG: pyruvate carboxylase [Clostridia bacterium]|nr:pyruvate carboxylase [Clostridia bacterium]
MKKFSKVLVANRGEIALRVIRACKELGIRTVAVYSKEDEGAIFHTAADEAYMIGKGKAPVAAYLAIDEIIALAKNKNVEAIHPGYGFLAENSEFAKACEDAGIEFIGPTHEMMDALGDKIQSKLVAASVGVPTIPGEEKAIENGEEALRIAKACGFPVMLKAAAGGGGRGMRIVRNEEDLVYQFESAKNEAGKAFGIDDVFIEKYVENPKHIEVQILGDKYGNIVHLGERDCSIQRRHQKVVEFTPSLTLSDEKREEICQDAIKIASAVNYRNAGTLEFLVDQNGDHFFIEMNPRIQVEHTVTEMVTGIDIVQAQILIAEGCELNSEAIGIYSQEDIKVNGFAIQCRITTEDPANDFAPDTGVIESYRSSSGYGIRLDGGNAFNGAVISPYYDSLLVKVTAWGRTFDIAANKAVRALRETRINGVKTNVGFLLNVLNHPTFRAGECNTGFIGSNPELLDIRKTDEAEEKIIKYIGNIVVNKTKGQKPDFDIPVVPNISRKQVLPLKGTKQILDELGPKGLADWTMNQKKLLITDTTMRDAQQSLMATRVRTKDIEKIAPATAYYGKDLYSLEMWGGATFDTEIRFLNEDPWERLETLRKEIPNVLFQMLVRGSNTVGYKNYPDNVVRRFIQESAKGGIDIFRVFDSLNWMEGMKIALDEVMNQNKVAEGCLCYTGDILDEKRDKYNLEYYVKMGKELEKFGCHMLGIKDMSGLLKPAAAYKLVKALKEELSIPIHLHTHDTTGNGVATVMMASEAGVDVVDAAINSMSGLTSQPALNSIAAAMQNSERDPQLDVDGLQKISEYWRDVRPVYKEFESGLQTATAQIYKYEIPGGQYSNLKPQVESFGLGHKFEEVKEMYKTVNDMFGDLIKVTPSSKVVGDMAIFMVQNDLTPENIFEKAKNMDFPDSVVTFYEGMIGQPYGGFNKDIQDLVLKGKEPITVRPGELLEDEDFDAIKKLLKDELDMDATEQDLVSYAIYPKVFMDYCKKVKKEGSFRHMGSDVFFHGLKVGELCTVEDGTGKKYMVRLEEIGEPTNEGTRDVVFEIDGNRRIVTIKDESLEGLTQGTSTLLADEENPFEVGSNIPGNIIKVLVKEGDKVAEGDPVAVVEAMKMETNILATATGEVEKVYVSEGQKVKAGEMIVKIK